MHMVELMPSHADEDITFFVICEVGLQGRILSSLPFPVLLMVLRRDVGLLPMLLKPLVCYSLKRDSCITSGFAG